MKIPHIPSLMILRIILGGVLVWMGILKLFSVSPTDEIIAKALPALGQSQLLLFVSAFLEILIGAALLANKFVKFASIIMCISTFLVTFTVLFTQGFDPRFPVLSLAGEHALKNFVFIAVGLLLLTNHEEHSTAHKHDPESST